jgi:hypothetical protein
MPQVKFLAILALDQLEVWSDDYARCVYIIHIVWQKLDESVTSEDICNSRRKM